MKIGFIVRKNHATWGGDIAVVEGYKRGLIAIGHEVIFSYSVFGLVGCDIVFLTNSTVEQRASLDEIEMLGIPFGVLGFHEDILLYYTAAIGMRNYICQCMGYGFSSDNGVECDIEKLFFMPTIPYYYGDPPKRTTIYNYDQMLKASFWITNSPTEAKTVERDYPGSKIVTIPVAPGIVTAMHKGEWKEKIDTSFLEMVSLPSKSYLLQVGRLEVRKNQLGTIIATKNSDIPLVFIATQAFDSTYELACFEAAARYRKGPTLFMSQNLREGSQGKARIIPMPRGDKLSLETLVSAYHHAGLHIHPAFYELPGATYLEAAALGIPSIASSWTTIGDYFLDSKNGSRSLDGRIVYCNPCDIGEIERAITPLFGKEFPQMDTHPSIIRSEEAMAKELIFAIETHICP